MATIALEVDTEAAEAFRAAPEDEQRKLQLLLGLRLRELTSPPARTLSVIMDTIGARAASLGLTEEQLKALLDAE